MSASEHRDQPRRTWPGACLIMLAVAALLLAVATNSIWLTGAAIIPVAAHVLREQSPAGASRTTAATLAAAASLILIGLGIAHA